MSPTPPFSVYTFFFCCFILPLTHNLSNVPFSFFSVTFNPVLPTCLPTSYCFFILTSPSPYSSSSSFILAQCVLEEMASREAELGRLREKAHRLWEGQAAGKGFVHRVSQLSAQYLALSNLTKVTLLPSCNPATPFLVPLLYLCVST